MSIFNKTGREKSVGLFLPRPLGFRGQIVALQGWLEQRAIGVIRAEYFMSVLNKNICFNLYCATIILSQPNFCAQTSLVPSSAKLINLVKNNEEQFCSHKKLNFQAVKLGHKPWWINSLQRQATGGRSSPGSRVSQPNFSFRRHFGKLLVIRTHRVQPEKLLAACKMLILTAVKMRQND